MFTSVICLIQIQAVRKKKLYFLITYLFSLPIIANLLLSYDYRILTKTPLELTL